jgi:hyperosmotically inducible periplasmic protein
MTNVSTTTRFALMAAALTLAGCAATRTHESPGEYADDTGTTARVKAALIEDQETKAHQIDVETFRGVVQLNGFVDSAPAKLQATRVAESVSGVQEVHNNLLVRTQERSAGAVIDDSTITTRLKAALIANPDTKASQINVTTREGIVQLSGFVDDAKEKAAAESAARDIAGVRDVRNELEIKTMR